MFWQSLEKTYGARVTFLWCQGKIIFEFKDSIEPGLDSATFTKELERKIYN